MASLGTGPNWSAALIEASFRLSWRHRDELLRIGLVPTLLSFLLQLVERMATTDAAMLASTLLMIPPLGIFSVAGYRLLLLGPGSLPPGLFTGAGRREIRYMLLTFGVGLLGAVVLGIPLSLLAAGIAGDTGGILLALCLAALLAVYGFGRVCLIFPACAVDAPMSLAESVRRTAGVGGRLALALLATGALSGAATMFASLLLSALGLWDAAPLASSFLLTALAYAGTAVMLVPPALAFRELSGWRGPAGPSLSVVP
jgi:hypothetical protein